MIASTKAVAATTATLLVAVAGLTIQPSATSTIVADPDAGAGCAVPNPAPHSGSSASSAGVRLRPGGPARPVLLHLAARITATACDAAPGRFNVVHHHRWTYNTSGGVKEAQAVRWYAADDSGAELATRPPSRQVAHDWWRPGDLRIRNLTNAYTTSAWLISDAQLNGWGDDTPALLDGLAALALWYSPDRQQRGLALRVLADASGLTAHPALDRAGRIGVALVATSRHGRTRHLLILDPCTGQILAYETATLTPSGWRSQVYVLLLTRTHASRSWWEPAASANPVPPQRQVHPRQARVWLTHQDPPCLTNRTNLE
jgi:hypothetical protein